MSHLYALLVGIDEYPRKPLSGCVNDARAWESFLKERVGEGGRLGLEVLLDEAATRGAIIETFRSHLGQAGEGDTAFFCYSGHGSQEFAPEIYAAEEPGGLSETLVACDSRTDGGIDIADKELAVLIAEVALRGAHVVVILDSCHSGTATRDPADEGQVRRMVRSHRRRADGSYWFQEAGAALPAALDSAGGWRVLPAGRHVLLAACEDYQTARECTAADGAKRGVFSYCLLDVLSRSAEGLTYRELFKRAQTRVTNLLPEQCPQAEGDLDRVLLDGAVSRRPARLHVSFHRDGTFWLDAGAVHAVQTGSEVAVLAVGAPESEDLSQALATARIAEVGAATSRIEILEGEVPRRPEAHPAVVTRLPLPPLRVAVEGDARETRAIREALGLSPFLALASEPGGADLRMRLEAGSWHLRRPGAAADLTAPIEARLRPPRDLVEALEHVARWQTLAGLSNPGSPLTEALEMTIWEWHPPAAPGANPRLEPLPPEGELCLPYREGTGGDPQPPRVCAHLRNRWEQALYYALLALDESFAVRLIEGGTGRLAAGEEVWVRSAAGIPAAVPDRYHQQGVTRRRDLLVLLVSTADADISLLEQGSLFETATRRAAPPRAAKPGLLDALLRRVAWREMDEAPLLADQWAAKSVAVVSVRPQPWHALPAMGGAVELMPGVILHAPDGLHGEVRLAGPGLEHGFPGLAALRAEERSQLRPVALAGALASDPGLSVLDLRLSDWESLSPASPLVLEAEASLGEREALAGIAWNGRESGWIPPVAGRSAAARLEIGSLPAPAPGSDTVSVEIFARSGRA